MLKKGTILCTHFSPNKAINKYNNQNAMQVNIEDMVGKHFQIFKWAVLTKDASTNDIKGTEINWTKV